MVNCLCIGIVFATIVPIVNTYEPCDDGSLNGIICTSGCCGDNDNPGFLKCCNRYAEEGFVPGDEDYPIVSPTLSPNPPPVIVPVIPVIVLLVIILIFICCAKFCLKKLRKTERQTDQLEQGPNNQQSNRSRPLQSLQTISGSVVRTNIAMQDPPPYEVLGAYYSNEPPIQVVNKQPGIDVRNSIGRPPPYEIRRTACPNSPSLQAGNLAPRTPLRNNTEEPPAYEDVVADYNYL
ncbi:hypothetical protein MAR_001461 [Mya arenaria]|uniref:Uncharacterized protein n=1 Tax=Mya arenaria TaxID=6604 RepID=A0ABY7FBU6_MYAAR|nr:uncharacterized protein LOC128207310 isoform X2 [Mya arenaria]WAR19623.1 hypothetical protein MAR_001461 [Mya arenaria]